MEEKTMRALPALFYRDPAECLDELRRMGELAKRIADRHRMHKRRRIIALVKEAMKGKR